MTNNELLLAMSEMMDTKLQPIEQDIVGIKDEITGIKDEITGIKDEITGIKDEITGIKLHLEHSTDKNIQILAENHINLSNKLNEAIPVVNKNSMYEIKVDYLTIEIDKLKKEMSDLKSKVS